MNNTLRVADIVDAIQNGHAEVLDKLDANERAFVLRAVKDLKKGDSRLLSRVWQEDFVQPPPTVDQFLDDPYYFGRIGKSIYPVWRRELREVLKTENEIAEWVIGGSIGIGKTYIAVVALCYKILRLMLMRSPQEFYGLTEGTPIVFGFFNIFKYLAMDTSYTYFQSFLKLSPFFRERCISKDGKESFVGFPNGIGIAVGAQAIHALGQNLYGGLLDEANFGKGSSLTSEERSQVLDLYLGVRRRIESRFMQVGGRTPGLLCLVSSARAQGDFLQKHIEETRHDPRTKHTAYALWDVKEKFKKSPRFYVLIGDRERSSRILDKPEDAPAGADIMAVPVEFQEQFRRNLDECIRDLGGRPTFGKSLLIPRREMIFECIRTSTAREHPFTVDEIELSIEPSDPTNIIRALNKPALLDIYDKTNDRWRPRFHPNMGRCIHVDLAKNGDCAAISMAGISQVRRIERFDNEGQRYTTTDLVYWIDFMLRIRALPGSEIDFRKIREFIFYLREMGYDIIQVSYDGFQSTESLQELYKAGFEVKVLSIDRSSVPYYTLRSVIMEGRLDLYHYQPFVDEILELQDHSRESVKRGPAIDHPDGGSKDVTDSVCGAIYSLLLLKHSEAQMPSPHGRLAEFRTEIDPVEKIEGWIAPLERNPLNALFPEDNDD